MKMSMLKVGEPDKDGEREYTFSVLVNRQPVVYQVRARHEHDASDRLSRYVEGDAASLQELGAGETGATLVLLGAVAAGAYVIYKHLKVKKAPIMRPGQVKARPLVNNGAEVAATDTGDAGDTDGSPDAGFTAQAARSNQSPFSVTATAARSSPTAARSGSTFARRSFSRGAVRGNVASGEIVDAQVTSWRPLVYHGATGKLAGDDPTKALKIVVFSDLPADQFLTLARSSSFDAARGTLRDAIAVLAFPAAAAATVRSPGAVEVMIGGTPTREFDVTAATADEALSSVRSLLAPYL